MNELSPPVRSWSWSIHCTLCKLTMHKSYFFFPNTTLHWTHWDYHCGYQMYCIVKAIKNWVNGNNSRNTRHVPIYVYRTYSTFIDKHWYWFNWLDHCILCVFFFRNQWSLVLFLVQFEFMLTTVHVNTDHFSQWKKCPYFSNHFYNMLQSSDLHLYAQCSPNINIFTQNMAKCTKLPSFFLYNVTAHFPLWWKTFVSHKILRLLITLEPIPKPSFTKHSLKQSRQQSNESIKIWKRSWKKKTAVQLW